MSKSILNSTMIAAAIAVSLLAPAQAQAPRPASAGATLGQAIAEQGNAALRLIRAEAKAAAKAMRPMLPTGRANRVSLPAAAGSLPATAAAAE
jgi:hypothetical protein